MELIIEDQKILNYLLVPKEKNDKSKFLNKLGFNFENYLELKNEIYKIAKENQAILQSKVPFGGELYEISGNLRGKGIITIWLLKTNENTFRFITLYPKK